MKDIDDFLKLASYQDVHIPDIIEQRIENTLKNKKRENIFIAIMRKILLFIASIIAMLVSSVAVYAFVSGVSIENPILDFLGINSSEKYQEYKQSVENQIVTFNDTSVNFVSTFCTDGLTILEFNLKLSEEDYKKLKIDQSILTDYDLQIFEDNKKNVREDIILEIKNEYILKNHNYEINFDDIVIPEEEIEKRFEERMKEIEKPIEQRKNTKFIPALCFNFNQGGDASIYIDDMPYYITNYEKVSKVSDYEYEIYIMYSITDDVLQGKNDFKITLKNNKLLSIENWDNINGGNDCQRFASNTDNTIDLSGDIEVQVSKDDILKDSIVLENPGISSKFRNITQTIEKVIISPVNTIVRINHSATGQSSNSFHHKYPDNPNIEHLPMCIGYKIYDSDGNQLKYTGSSNNNTLIYSDGTREEYDHHDFPDKEYSNAIWEQIEYIFFENVDTDYIKIVPIEIIQNPIDGSEDDGAEINYEMDPLIINLN